ncbi:hypothetical protein ES705_45188 [subsurface metagenome]
MFLVFFKLVLPFPALIFIDFFSVQKALIPADIVISIEISLHKLLRIILPEPDKFTAQAVLT